MALQPVDGVLGTLAYGQDSSRGVQDAEGHMVRAGVWYLNGIGVVSVDVVIHLDGFTVALSGVVE